MNVNIMFMLNKQIWRKDFHVTTDQIFLFHIIVGQSKRDISYLSFELHRSEGGW